MLAAYFNITAKKHTRGAFFAMLKVIGCRGFLIDVRMTELRYVLVKMLVQVVATSLVVVGAVAVEIPVEPDSTAVLPAFLTEVVTGAPADSLILRVSFYSRQGDGRFDTWAFIVVEEIQWPFPPITVRMDIEGVNDTDDEEQPSPLIISAVSKIEGWFLNQTRRKIVSSNPAPGMRAGELGGHWVHAFEFVEWVNPLLFVVTDGRGMFEIRWVGRSRFELVSVEGVR